MQQIEAVIFDFDDTLIDWSGVSETMGFLTQPHIENVRRYLVEQGHTVPDADAFFDHYRDVVVGNWQTAKQSWAGVSFNRCLEDLLARLALEPADINLEAMMQAYDFQPVPGVVPFPDAAETLAAVRERGYKIGLVTNAMFPMWMRDVELEAFGLLDFFDARITSGDTGYMKPHPAIYERIAGLLGVAPETAVFVGDRPANDIAGANEVGMISVLMSPSHLDRDLNGVEPDYKIARLSELVPILEELEGEEIRD